jgi:hypothetical protein
MNRIFHLGAADQPHPKISFFRRVCPNNLGVRRESGRFFHKASNFVKAL